MSGLVRVFWLGRAFLLHARIASAARGGWSAERCSALTRRYVGVDDGFVNCGPSRRYVWPVLAPAEGIVRAGVGLRGEAALARGCVRPVPVVRFYRNVVCLFAPIMRSFRNVVCLFAPIMRSSRNVLCSITPAVCRLCAKQDGLRYVVFLFRRGS